MGRLIEVIFTKVYVAMLASGIFFLLSICGGLVLGFGPAGTTVMSLVHAYGDDYKSYKWSEAWSLFKSNFWISNQIFYSFLGLYALLTYGVFLMVQLPKQSLFYIFLSLLDVIFLLILPLVYMMYLKLQVHFELSYKNSIKLAVISLFIAPISAVLKLGIGTILLLLVSWYAPALGFFVLIGLWHFFVDDVLEPIYDLVEARLVG